MQNRPELDLIIYKIGSTISNKSEAPLLRSRGFLTATKLSDFLLRKYLNDVDTLLEMFVVAVVDKTESLPVKVAALNALSVFFDQCFPEVIKAIKFSFKILLVIFHLFKEYRKINN